jgi:hypothetical protein
VVIRVIIMNLIPAYFFPARPVTKQKHIPVVVEDDPWDGFFGRRFNASINSTIYKINYFLHNNPGKIFLAGVGTGGLVGFLMGFQTGAFVGIGMAKFLK